MGGEVSPIDPAGICSDHQPHSVPWSSRWALQIAELSPLMNTGRSVVMPTKKHVFFFSYSVCSRLLPAATHGPFETSLKDQRCSPCLIALVLNLLQAFNSIEMCVVWMRVTSPLLIFSLPFPSWQPKHCGVSKFYFSQSGVICRFYCSSLAAFCSILLHLLRNKFLR